MERKISVVSGGNRGLGLGASRALLAKGYDVVMLGRNPEKIEQAAKEAQLDARSRVGDSGGKAIPFQADVMDSRGLVALSEMISQQYGRVDVLINNAGVLLESSEGADQASAFKVDPETVLKTFQTNSLGPLRLTQALIELLKKSPSARIVNVSSGMGALSEMEGGYPGYRMSKTALNALTRILASELAGTKIKVNSVCPGWVRTDMGGPGAERSIEEGVSGIVWAATLPEDGPTGGFFRDGEPIEW